MQAKEILDRARDTMSVQRVFGEPIRDGDLTVVPVARIAGGAGAGSGQNDDGGGGFGMNAQAIGVFEIRNGTATYKPAVDVNRVIMGGQIIAVVLILVVGSIIRARVRSDD